MLGMASALRFSGVCESSLEQTSRYPFRRRSDLTVDNAPNYTRNYVLVLLMKFERGDIFELKAGFTPNNWAGFGRPLIQ